MAQPQFRVEVPDDGYWRRQIKCQDACPVHTDARGYVTGIGDADLRTAYIIAREPNPFAFRGVGGILGQDLTFVGGRRRDPEWLLRHFRDPQSTSPGSAMPPFKHLPEGELKALTVDMLSLREMPSALLAEPVKP